jgi:RND superfamily putative drug exporter
LYADCLGDRVLPASAPARQMFDQIRANIVQEEADAVQVVSQASDPATAARTRPRCPASTVSSVSNPHRAPMWTDSRLGPRPASGTPVGSGTWLSVVFSSSHLDA